MVDGMPGTRRAVAGFGEQPHRAVPDPRDLSAQGFTLPAEHLLVPPERGLRIADREVDVMEGNPVDLRRLDDVKSGTEWIFDPGCEAEAWDGMSQL